MIQTRVTELLHVEYPLIQGGIMWLSDASFAAAVSNAGGLGVITAMSFPDKEALRREIKKCRKLTDKPFGVNVSMLPTVMPSDRTEECFDVVLNEGVTVVETAGRNPEQYIKRLKEGGVKLIHKVPAVRFAKKAEEIGVDAVELVGFECAGHPGMDDVTTLILIQRATKEVRIPVIAGGGFCDARGLVAALAVGAEGVLMGTRFMMTYECWAHARIKEVLLRATERDTMMVGKSTGYPTRLFRNRPAETVAEMEQKGASLEELVTVMSGRLGRKAYLEGDIDAGVIPCGQVIGLIDEIKSVKEIMEEIVGGAREIYKRLNNNLGDHILDTEV